ncbi:MAG: PAS domain S-box protein [Gammaproteobacteria bacterium]|jgi:PAS domain S-box-containing protein|nr:PAS domain S-box protein [Gammaproteobacteria bacterium]MBT3870146.1 PAS domain S-box protein [Gammaproteobacteria bacterium]MBT4381733.1 PAS domain S-box protein [Gammaproteobacteria bacterium]MBT4619196.1 PAS domain S-box protein [Gammaproteobacteria bacterium]MBT5198855.1 PAS domain S-box protein [Gammaproteobacteria bacterium]
MATSQRTLRPLSSLGRNPIIVVVLLCVTFGVGITYSLITGNRLSQRYIPLVDAAMEIKLEATLGHLWFEEAISGDSHEEIATVREHFKTAGWYAQAMLEGGENQEGVIIPLSDPLLHHAIVEVLTKLEEFAAVADERWAKADRSGVGSAMDQRFDAIFTDFLAQAGYVETALQEAITQDLRRFRIVQIMLLILCLGMTILAAMVLRFYIHEQAQNLTELEKSTERLKIYSRDLEQEILHRQQAELRLRTQAEVITNMTEGIYLRRASDDTIVFTNPAFDEMFGYAPHELIGKHASIVNAYEEINQEEAARKIMEVISEAGRWQGEIRSKRKNDTEFWSFTSIALFEHPEFGAVLVSTHTDITNQKQTQDELQESYRRFERVVIDAPVPIMIHADDGEVILLSKTWTDITGYTLTDIPTVKAWASKAYGAQKETVLAETVLKDIEASHGKKDDRIRGDYVVATKSGDQVTWAFSSATMGGLPDGRALVMSMASDITERKRMVDELQKIEKLESIGIFAGGIAHDLNNFLTSIVGSIELAIMCDDLVEKNEVLVTAEKETLKIKGLTQQLITFAKGGSPVKRVSNLRSLITDSVSFALTGSNISSNLVLADDLYSANVDEGQIGQVINNMILNARQAMHEGGGITVSAANVELGQQHSLPLEAGHYVKLSIEDSGEGIPKEIQSRIFDPFFSTKQAGNGLGLATTFSIIQKHDGHISVSSEMGVGTTFDIHLPASQKKSEQHKDGRAESVQPKGESKILMMDDQQSILKMVGRSLDKIGYKVEGAEHGKQTVEKYKEAMDTGRPFHGVVLDLTIPGGMGGAETMKHLLALDPSVVAIVASGYSNDPVMMNYKDYGFKAVLTKPYMPRDLHKLLSTILDKN